MALSVDSIIAQCTPKGSGAIGLIRISGPTSIKIADAIISLSNKKKLSDLPSHSIHYGTIVRNDGTSIDTALFLLMRAPKTFTGEDTVEITCHNNQFIIEEIIGRAISAGARLAGPGEFTKQAVLNKKMDLIQAEAINEVIQANSQQALKQSLSQLSGSLSSRIEQIEKQLVQAVALCEASFEFLDEEELEFGTQVANILKAIEREISVLENSYAQQKQIREGIRIAFIGSVNAGKSSLFNALVGSKRSIVTNQAGTTRDVVETGMYEDGFYWTLIDTAGLRETDNVIELEGIERSYSEAERADIILLIIDGSRETTRQELDIYRDLLKQYHSKTVLLYNKSDQKSRGTKLQSEYHTISSKEAIAADYMRKTIKNQAAQLFDKESSPYLLNTRQHTLLMSLKGKIKSLQPLFKEPIAYEILSHHLNEALSDLSELTGKTSSERAMNAIFREFCVGK